MPFEQYKYQNKYNKEHYARLSINIPLEEKSILEEHWKSKGYKHFSNYVIDLIHKDMNESKNNNVHINTINQNGNGTINIG